ncbi:MAG TPA: hypothetical protein VLE51_02425 [Candidatus Saccharimonadales bacterium]|nr:hypothetical protein [Candidatus Saccharimonadales bacterium]
MRPDADGHTIIEVMIVLAVTGALFASALNVFSSQKSNTEFTQTMQDLNSKVQTYVNQVNSESFPDVQGYTCDLSGGRPKLTLGAGNGLGSNQACIFLGRAIEAEANSITITGFIVLSSRCKTLNPCSPIDSFYDGSGNPRVNPEPAYDGSQIIFKDNYNLFFEGVIKSSKVKDINNASHSTSLVGIYSDLGASTLNNGTVPLILIGYPLDSPANVKNCIEFQSPCGVASVTAATEWDLCVQNGNDSNKTAVLIVKNTAAGVSTQISYTTCS